MILREYDSATLKKVQNAELGILADFIKVCDENGIDYFGLAGTGIGALRHGGFIPWDDDIDVGLLRKDYDRVIEIFRRDFGDKYTVVNGDYYKKYPLMTTRIVINGTSFVEESLKGIDCPLGIFLDVYAFDNVAPDEKKKKKQVHKAWLYSKLLILRHIPFPVLPFKGIKGKICHCITFMAYLFLNIFFVSHNFIYRKCLKYSTMYNGEDTGVYGFFCDTDAYSQILAKDEIFPVRKIGFESLEMSFPNELEKLLTALYGDYMQLPPEEKRKNHFPYRLDFGSTEEKD